MMHKINSTFVPFFTSDEIKDCKIEEGRRFNSLTQKDEWSITYLTPCGEYAFCPMLDVKVQWNKSTTINRYLYKVNPDGTLDHTNYYYYCTHMENIIVWKHVSLR